MKDSCVEVVNTGIAFGEAVSVWVQWFKPDETSETDGLCHLCEGPASVKHTLTSQ